MKRREFLGKSLTSVAVCCGLSQISVPAFGITPVVLKKNNNRVGIQLYSIKDELQKDFTGSLRKLADIGYSSVEAYGFDGNLFFGKTLKELNKILKGMGMKLSGTHTGSGEISSDRNDPALDFWRKCSQEVKAGGAKWAIQSWLPEPKTMDELKKLADHYNRVGEVCKKTGVKFGHHNHSAEFNKVNDIVIMDFLLENTDPSLVCFQFDMGHALEAGADVVAYVKKYPGRFLCWHATDHKKGVGDVELGRGDVDYDALFQLADFSGLQELTVEQETGTDRFNSCQIDFDFLRKYPWTKIN